MGNFHHSNTPLLHYSTIHTMDLGLRGNNAIVTGAAGGVGRAIALELSKEGANVVIMDISEQNIKDTTDEIKAVGGTITAVQGDVTNSDDIKATVAKAIEEYGKVDILFNYVGGEPDVRPPGKPFWEQTEERWNQTIKLNLISTMVFSQAVLNSMIKQNYGKIINTSAVAALTGGGGVIAYSAAKSGVIAFTKALAREVAPHNINVNCLCLGPIDTPGLAMMSEGQYRGKPETRGGRPLRRIGRPEEVASAVLYLASDDAAYITGQTLTMDGGMTMV